MSEELIAAIDRAIRITRHTDTRTALWTRDDCAVSGIATTRRQSSAR